MSNVYGGTNSINIVDIIQTAAIVITLLITLFVFAKNIANLKVQSQFSVNQAHREIWGNLYSSDKVSRVFSKNPDLIQCPVTEEEKMFVNMIFLHMSACLRAIKLKNIYKIEGIKEDLADILSYKIPQIVWNEVERFHDKHFIKFVNRTMNKIIAEKTAKNKNEIS